LHGWERERADRLVQLVRTEPLVEFGLAVELVLEPLVLVIQFKLVTLVEFELLELPFVVVEQFLEVQLVLELQLVIELFEQLRFGAVEPAATLILPPGTRPTPGLVPGFVLAGTSVPGLRSALRESLERRSVDQDEAVPLGL
jgi:hypothetical protein